MASSEIEPVTLYYWNYLQSDIKRYTYVLCCILKFEQLIDYPILIVVSLFLCCYILNSCIVAQIIVVPYTQKCIQLD